MKTTQFTIENMDKVRNAVNEALSEAMKLMQRKSCDEADVTLGIHLELKPDGGNNSWIPTIKYKTNVAVPMKVKKTGSQTNCSQVRWDNDSKAYMMSVTGEQVTIEGK